MISIFSFRKARVNRENKYLTGQEYMSSITAGLFELPTLRYS